MGSLALLLALSVAGSAVLAAQNAGGFPPVPRPEEAGMSSDRLARIDQMVNDVIAKGEIPGAVVFISRGGRVVWYKAYGHRDGETKAPMRRDDIFRIASQSKAITSLAVMMLLTHTSGIDYAAIGSDEFKAVYAKAGVPSGIGNDRWTIGEKVRVLGRLPLKHQPGERFTYSLSLDVLGYLVEVVSGMPFDRFLRTRIFEPLGMKDTWFYLPPDRAGRLVTIHDGESGKAVPMRQKVFDGVDPNFPAIKGTYFSGGAGLSSSVEDYARFLQLFLNQGEFNGVRLLSPKTVELMLTEQNPGLDAEYGIGFGLETGDNDHQSPKSLGSFSWGGAFATTYWADPKEHLIGQIYTNMYNSAAAWELGGRFTVLTYAAIVK